VQITLLVKQPPRLDYSNDFLNECTSNHEESITTIYCLSLNLKVRAKNYVREEEKE